MFVCAIYAEGAPSLRFLQGRVAMLPTRLLSFCTNPVAYAFVVPALCKLRKGRGTLCFVCASEIKSLGHPPRMFLSVTVSARHGALTIIDIIRGVRFARLLLAALANLNVVLPHPLE
jgi:hypothetical protein